MPKTWSENSRNDKCVKPLKRGYKHCRRNGNLKRGYCRELCSCHVQWPQSHGCKPCAIPPCHSQVHPEPALNPRNNHVPQKDPVARDPGKYHMTPHVMLHMTCHVIHLLVTCHETKH